MLPVLSNTFSFLDTGETMKLLVFRQDFVGQRNMCRSDMCDFQTEFIKSSHTKLWKMC